MDEQGIQFPLRGLNTAVPYDGQPDGTTPQAENVRSFDPLTKRMRGGSRPGISKYVDDDIGGLIQELTSIVYPSATALGISFDDVAVLDTGFQIEDPVGLTLADGTTNWIYANGSGFYTHPSYSRTTQAPTITSLSPDSGIFDGGDIITVTGTNMGDTNAAFSFGSDPAANVIYNDGTTAQITSPSVTDPGSAVTVNVTVETVIGTSPTNSNTVFTFNEIEYVQSAGVVQLALMGSSDTITLGSNVTSGNLILVLAALPSGESAASLSVTDTLSTSYAQAAALGTGDEAGWDHYYFYGHASSSGANTITLNHPPSLGYLIALEYSGVRTVFPVEDSDISEVEVASSSYSSPTLTVNGSARLVVFWFQFGDDAGTLSGFSGYTQRLYGTQNAVYDNIDVDSGSASTSGSGNSIPSHYVSGISFKPIGTQ